MDATKEARWIEAAKALGISLEEYRAFMAQECVWVRVSGSGVK